MTNVLREKLESGVPIFGTFVTMTDPAAVEVAALAGFDYAIADLEHAAIDAESLQNHMRAARARGIGLLVRVAGNVKHEILRVLEAGAEGIMVPHIASRSDAERAVSAVRYAPLGSRGIYDNTRAGDYSAHGLGGYREYTERANAEVVLVFLIEDKEGVDNAGEIAAVEGVDVIAVGPADLSFSMGLYGSVGHPDIAAAAAQVRAACARNSVRFALPPDHGTYPVPADELIANGQVFFFRGSDCGAMLDGMRQRLAIMKGRGLAAVQA